MMSQHIFVKGNGGGLRQFRVQYSYEPYDIDLDYKVDEIVKVMNEYDGIEQ